MMPIAGPVVVVTAALLLSLGLSSCGTDTACTPVRSHAVGSKAKKRPVVSHKVPTPEDEGEWNVRIGDHRLSLEVADTPARRGLGLSRRRHLREDKGMVFLYPDAEPRRYWMKDTWVPLDIAFLDQDGVILNVVSLDPPPPGCRDEDIPRARSRGSAQFVIEMPRGWFAKAGAGAGSPVVFSQGLAHRAGKVSR